MQASLLYQLIQFAAIVEMLAETVDEFFTGVIVTLRTALLEAIDRSQRTDLAAQLPVEAARVPRQEPASEGIAHAGGVHDLIFRDGGNVNGILARVKIRAIFPARDHQRVDMIEDLIQAPAGLLGDQT